MSSACFGFNCRHTFHIQRGPPEPEPAPCIMIANTKGTAAANLHARRESASTNVSSQYCLGGGLQQTAASQYIMPRKQSSGMTKLRTWRANGAECLCAAMKKKKNQNHLSSAGRLPWKQGTPPPLLPLFILLALSFYNHRSYETAERGFRGTKWSWFFLFCLFLIRKLQEGTLLKKTKLSTRIGFSVMLWGNLIFTPKPVAAVSSSKGRDIQRTTGFSVTCRWTIFPSSLLKAANETWT